MKFYTCGKREKPVILMLGGSFCPAVAMNYLYDDLSRDYYVIVPEYNGHYEGTVFTTRQGEAREAAGFLAAQGINELCLLYGMSMGAEVGIELLHQLTVQGIAVRAAFFDGAPCIKLSAPYKAFMYLKFKSLIAICRNKSVDDVLNMGLIKKLANGSAEALRPMISTVKQTAAWLTDESIKNETECCYTFDFPAISEDMQERMYFFYAKEEKAYKTCYDLVRRAYPKANYKVVSGYGHMTYSVENTTKYLDLLRKICGEVK